MFVRIVWNTIPARPHQPRDRRGIRTPPRSACGDLGIPAPDFAKMTKGLFDRPE